MKNEDAANLYKILTTFIEGLNTVESLENYYLGNKKTIALMRSLDEQCYINLINDFKKQKQQVLDEGSDTNKS